MSNITIELCAEDRARLDRLAAALEARTCDKCVAAVYKAAQEPQNEAQEAEKVKAPATIPETAPEPAKAEEQPAAPADTDVPKVSIPDVRKLVIKLAQAGKTAEVRDIVTAYAESVPLIPEDKLYEVYTQLTALEMEG